MSIPAAPKRRARIQWHDDGSVHSSRSNFLEVVSPQRALLLAGGLALASFVAVASIVQFQWNVEGGDALVEAAEAAPLAEPVRTVAVAKPEISSPSAPIKASVSANAAVTARPQTSTTPQAAQPTIGNASTAGSKPILTTAAASDDVSLSPLPRSDARWKTAAGKEPKTLSQSREGEEEALAFAPVEAPRPQSAPRDSKAVLAAVAANADKEAAETNLLSAKIRKSVFLRAKPGSRAKVLTTIPSGASVKVAQGCEHWCSVTYEGQKGYVYKSFVTR